ncbi:hypothetical protein Tcan_13833 [Toxocara canis]|uniref:Uncharacterized protein n=1 Tax=Toxocara canis TaxID=6265 RepID=A0A0B2VJ00_TOXCA|nr:hypothetical protein Tcan_13833 [Toxocara canis]
MPNTGTFFVRGEYITKYNTRSNSIKDAIPETKTSNAAAKKISRGTAQCNESKNKAEWNNARRSHHAHRRGSFPMP